MHCWHVYNHTLTFTKLATRATLVLRVIVARMESQWRHHGGGSD